MIDVWNRVMTNIKTAESGTCQYIYNSESDKPAGFPSLYVTQMDDRDYAVDLENSENGVMVSFRIQAFSAKSLMEARSVIAIACDAMRTMGFRRTLGPREIENVSDRNVKRCEARFRRFVNGINEIPKFATATTTSTTSSTTPTTP